MTTGTLELVRAADKLADVIDYIRAGPLRPTPTKDSGRTPLGMAAIAPWWRRIQPADRGDRRCAAGRCAGAGSDRYRRRGARPRDHGNVSPAQLSGTS